MQSLLPHYIWVLNLVISGMPSIQYTPTLNVSEDKVLNLVISGMPSIHETTIAAALGIGVLNLVISGMPSIPLILLEYWIHGCLVRFSILAIFDQNREILVLFHFLY